MARFITVVALVAFVAFCSAQKPEIQSIGENIEIIEDINVYRAEHPGLNLVPLSAKVDEPLGQIRYTLGQRVQGDRIVSQGNNSFYYPSPQDVRLNLNYPQSGIGAVVSFVEIVVNQSSIMGNAYITSGGIGQRQVTIIVEAKTTKHFIYRVSIFGF